MEVGGGHAAEHPLLGGVDGGFCGEEYLRRGGGGAGLDLEDDECGAVPGEKVEVAVEAWATPASADDGVAELAKVEEGGIFAALAGEEMRRERRVAVDAGAQEGVNAAFQRKCERGEAHGKA